MNLPEVPPPIPYSLFNDLAIISMMMPTLQALENNHKQQLNQKCKKTTETDVKVLPSLKMGAKSPLKSTDT